MNAKLTENELSTTQRNFHPNPAQSHSLHKDCSLDPAQVENFCSIIDMDTYKVKCHTHYSSHMAKAIQTPKDNNAYNIQNANVTNHAVWFL